MKLKLILLFGLLSLQGLTQKLYSDTAYKNVKSFVKIEDAIVNPDSVIKLILRKQKLTTIPREIFSFKNLEYLDLSKNKLDSIPLEITQLKKLKVLLLARNQIKVVPPEIYLLTDLKILNMSSNDITILPKGIRALSQLEELDIWNTSVGDLPNDIEKIKSLRVVDMRGILLNYERQEELFELLPDVKLYMSPPCNCSF